MTTTLNLFPTRVINVTFKVVVQTCETLPLCIHVTELLCCTVIAIVSLLCIVCVHVICVGSTLFNPVAPIGLGLCVGPNGGGP